MEMMGNRKPVAAVVNTSKASSGAPAQLQYPANIGSHAMMFSFIKYNRNKSYVEGKIINNIQLPIPQELNEVYSASYQDAELGTFGGEMLQAGLALSDAIENIQNTSGSKLSMAATEGGKILDRARDLSTTAAVGLALRRAVGGISNELGGVVDLAKGNIPNPHAALLFNGVNLRTHNFTWNLSPTNQKDEDKLLEIFNELKKHMHPTAKGITTSGGGDSLLTYPDEVDITFMGSSSSLYKIKRCVISALNINQAPNGAAFHAGTGNPVYYAVSMSLREVEIITRDDFTFPDIST